MNRKHLLRVLLGCALSLIALAALFFSRDELGTTILFALIFLCPLSHLLMLGSMSREQHAGPNHAQEGSRG